MEEDSARGGAAGEVDKIEATESGKIGGTRVQVREGWFRLEGTSVVVYQLRQLVLAVNITRGI